MRNNIKTVEDVLRVYNDNEYFTDIVSEVSENEDIFTIGIKSGGYFSFNKNSEVVPKVGDLVTFFGKSFFKPVRGIAFNGKIVYYYSPKQFRMKLREKYRKYDQKLREIFERNRSRMDNDYNELPELFRNRIDRLRREDKDFRWKYEEYELFCCKEAVKIVNVLKTREAILDWLKKDWDEQVKIVGLEGGHSNNSFNGAVSLALSLVSGKEV